MSIMDKSIASRIALLLGLFCLVLCAFLISLLQLLKMLSEEADETVNVALPNMAIASYISKESEWAKGILHDSILCRDRFVHLGVVQEIEARRFPENVLESLEALAVDPGVKEKIKNNLNELNGILAGTNQAVAQRIDNLRNTERLVKRIRTLNADLPQLERELYASGMKPGDPGFNVWKTAYSDVLTAMLLLSMHHDRPYSLRLKSEIRTDVKRLLRSAEASPFSGCLKKLSSDAATMALAEDGLLALYEEYTALESTLDALKITHQYTSNSLIESANAVSQQSWTSIQASKKTLAERYAVIVATVGVTFFLAVFLALFIYRSIVRNVVDPIKRLNNCMLDRVNRIPTPFPESVRYELAEMTSSVRYFTSEIEKHEQELLHSHENLEKQVAERTCELKALSEKLLMAQESERFKLASELHDNIGATLGAIKFGMERSLRSIRSLPEHELQPDICDTLSTSVSLVKKLATHLRRIQNELRPPQLELGLEATIADFCEEYERVFAHMPIELSIALDEEKLPPNLPIVIFRIIQEALSNIVAKLDVVRKQVFIEALIMEVSSEASFSFGINWAIGGNTGDAAIVGGVSLNGGAVSLSSSGANKTVSLPAGVSIGAILKDAITVGNTSYNIQSILNAVRDNSDVDVLATPQLLTLDNEEASVEVVDNIPFTKESTTRNDNDFTTQSMDYKDVGVKLKITPRISDDGSLRLEVEQEVSRVTQGLITLTNGDQLVAPTTRKRLVKTTILLQDSQTAVIGGLLDDQKTYNQSEVPGLGSIPVLGWLFKSRNKKSTQTNLFIFITPKVIRNAADSADLTREKQLVLHETSVGHDGLGLPIMSKPKLLKPVFVN